MQLLTNWTAKRAGAAITLTGLLADGREIKVAGVREIDRCPGKPHAIATTRNGELYQLA